MLQPHSFLWHYLWIGPHILQIGLALLLWRRHLHTRFPVFFWYLIYGTIEQFVLYALDLIPAVSVETWWVAFSIGLVIEGILRLAVMGELFSNLLRPRPAIARIGRQLITYVGAVLVLLATVAAAYAPVSDPRFSVISRAQILQQTLYMTECGLIACLFLFTARFKLTWSKAALGIGLGRGISASVHLATWAVMANGGLAHRFYLLDFLNMGTYHVCVLIWFYFLLVPQKSAVPSTVSLPENHLDLWNRELERLLQP